MRITRFIDSFCNGNGNGIRICIRNYNDDYYLNVGRRWVPLSVYSLAKLYGKEDWTSGLSRQTELRLTEKIINYVATLNVMCTASDSFLGPRSPFPMEVENHIFEYVGDDDDGAILILHKVLKDVMLSDSKIKTVVLEKYKALANYPAHAYDIFFQYWKICALGFLADAMHERLLREKCRKYGGDFAPVRERETHHVIGDAAVSRLRREWNSAGFVLNEEVQLFYDRELTGLFRERWRTRLPTFLSEHTNVLTNHDMYYLRMPLQWSFNRLLLV
jgi:hypothetical protein